MRTQLNNLTLLAVLALALAGCSEDSPTTPPTVQNTGDNVLVRSTSGLSFPVVCTGLFDRTRFEISAPATNTGNISGQVAISDGEAWFTITKGGGAYTLAPGASRTIEVEFRPSRAGVIDRGLVDLGYNETTVVLKGFGSSQPWVKFQSGRNVTEITSNYAPYLYEEHPVVAVTPGVAYGNPSWESCPGSAWIIDGNAIDEHGVYVPVRVPKGTESVLIELEMDAEDKCAQLLMQIDGKEHVRTNFGSSCETNRYRFDIEPGLRVISVGTDQQGIFCGADISLRSIKFTFEGRCLTASEYNPPPSS